MNKLYSVIWYARDCLKVYEEDYSQTIKVRALDRLLKAFDGKGSYFPMLAPETERHIEREVDAERSRLTPIELGQEQTFCACGHELNDHYRGFQFCAQCTCPEFKDTL